MKCNQIREMMPDLAAASNAAVTDSDVNQHLNACGDCALALEEFRQTMALLDQWQAPEPSPYFDVRLRARMREEAAKPASWVQWMRRPALAVSLAVMMVAGVTLYRGHEGGGITQPAQNLIASGPQIAAEPGTAVGDLQALDKNDELYSDFDVLDDLQVQQDVNATP